MAYHERDGRETNGGGYGAYDNARPRTRRPIFDDTVLYVRWNKMRKLGGHCLTKEPWLIPPQFRPTQPRYSIPARHLHSAQNKIKHPVNVVKWTPDGHRLLTGSASGEFTLWDGKAFNFVTIMSAHDSAVRAVDWSGSNEWMLSADQDGIVKYWNPQFNNVKQFQAHRDFAIRDIAFAPTDSKFVTASDDSTLKVWDFASAIEHSELKGHGWDVKTCDWHLERGLVVSGSKDHTVKLWDPRNGNCLTTLHGHKTPVTRVRFGGRNGMCLATCARDSAARIFDLRAMRDMLILRSGEKDITTVAWHPHHPSMVSTGSNDGAISHYILTNPNPPNGQLPGRSPYDTNEPETAPMQNIWPAHVTKYAHEMAIWSMDWHPKGLIFASGSNDRATRFWVRPLPSNTSWENDQWHKGANAAPAWRAPAPPTAHRRNGSALAEEDDMEDDEADALVDQKMPARPSMPGLGLPGLTPAGLPSMNADGTNGGGGPMHPSLNANGLPLIPRSGAGLALDPRNLPAGFPNFGGNGIVPPDPSIFPGGIPPPPSGFKFPPGFEPPPALMPGLRGPQAEQENVNAASIRRRAPLPSQEDSYRKEDSYLRKGGF